MSMSRKWAACGLLLFMVGGLPMALAQPGHVVPMQQKSAKTFYVHGHIAGVGPVDFLVDTGSSYNTIDEHSLAALQAAGRAHFVKELMGILASGERQRVAVYRLDAIRLGEACELRGVEAAVFPGGTRHILGLSGLRKAGNFSFSFEPPELGLSHCQPVASAEHAELDEQQTDGARHGEKHDGEHDDGQDGAHQSTALSLTEALQAGQ